MLLRAGAAQFVEDTQLIARQGVRQWSRQIAAADERMQQLCEKYLDPFERDELAAAKTMAAANAP